MKPQEPGEGRDPPRTIVLSLRLPDAVLPPLNPSTRCPSCPPLFSSPGYGAGNGLAAQPGEGRWARGLRGREEGEKQELGDQEEDRGLGTEVLADPGGVDVGLSASPGLGGGVKLLGQVRGQPSCPSSCLSELSLSPPPSAVRSFVELGLCMM